MKVFSLIFVLLVSVPAMAGVYACGSDGLASPDSLKAHAFFTSIQGRFELGTCKIELQMCDPNEPTQPGSIVGDIGVTDRYGQFFYLPFDFSKVQTERVTKIVLNGRRMVHYEFIERLPNDANGRSEVYRLEILKSEDLSGIESLDLGIYHSRIRERYPRLRPARSYWVNCGASER